MATYNHVYIYFDTNALEVRFNTKQLFLSQIKLSNLYFRIENMVKNMELQDKVHICIPEVVWLELLTHMRQNYRSERQSMKAKMDDFKKSFGDLVDFNIEFRLADNEKAYEEYLTEMAEAFISSKKIDAEIVPYPKDERTIGLLLEKATNTISPFSKAKGAHKEYSDAGFKDALIFETMLQHTGMNMGILITDDHDFDGTVKKVAGSNIKCMKSVEDVREFLVKNYNISGGKYLESRIRNNEYLLSRILEEAGFGCERRCVFEKIYEIQETDQGKNITLTLRVDGDVYTFFIKYDDGANELISAECIGDGGRERAVVTDL